MLGHIPTIVFRGFVPMIASGKGRPNHCRMVQLSVRKASFHKFRTGVALALKGL